jgi:hypothetical protein
VDGRGELILALQEVNMADLITRFDAVVPNQWEPYAIPTRESISTIEARFRFKLPMLLLDFALCSKSFSSFFLSLGPDIEDDGHIIAKNEMVRSNDDWLRLGNGVPAPGNLIFITENFMEDFFWCLDISYSGSEYPVVLWRPESDATDAQEWYAGVGDFIAGQVAYYESRFYGR